MPQDPPMPPAGWYPDPSGALQRRYWDGRAWTEQFAQPGGLGAGPAATAGFGASREADLEELHAGGRRAKVAVLIAVPIYAVTPVLQGMQVVTRWWTSYLVAIAVNLPLGVIAGFNDHMEVSVAAGALSLVVWLFAAINAREFIDATNESLAAEL